MMTARPNTYFLSDLHLGAAYISDPRAHERLVVDFLRSIEGDARAVYLLGDVLDYWFEYRTVVPRGFVRFFGQLARMADRGIEIVWFTGNHDIWLFDYLRDEIGIEIVDPSGSGISRLIDGTLFYLGHGDNFGPQPLGYRLIRAVFHNRVCQRLYASLHPRWTLPFAHGWSSHSRTSRRSAEPRPAHAPGVKAEVMAEARRLADEMPTLRHIIIGHYHRPLQQDVTPTCTLTMLGDWIRRSTYAVFDGKSLFLREFLAHV